MDRGCTRSHPFLLCYRAVATTQEAIKAFRGPSESACRGLPEAVAVEAEAREIRGPPDEMEIRGLWASDCKGLLELEIRGDRNWQPGQPRACGCGQPGARWSWITGADRNWQPRQSRACGRWQSRADWHWKSRQPRACWRRIARANWCWQSRKSGAIGIGNQGSQGPVGVGNQGSQGPVGVGSQGPAGVGNQGSQGPSGGIGSQGFQGPASGGGGGDFTVVSDSGTSLTGSSINLYGQAVGAIPYTGIYTQIDGTSLNIMNRRNLSSYVIDPDSTNPAEYTSVQDAYAAFLSDSRGGTNTPVVFLLRPGRYGFSSTLSLTKGGIIFEAIGGTTASNAVVFYAPGTSLTGIDVNCPTSHQPIEFHGITFGDSTTAMNVFTMSATSYSTLLINKCGAYRGMCTFVIPSAGTASNALFLDCYFQNRVYNALDFLTIGSSVQNTNVQLVNCVFDISTQSIRLNSIVNVQGQVNLKVHRCTVTADDLTSVLTVDSSSARVTVSNCSFSCAPLLVGSAVFQVSTVNQMYVYDCSAVGFDHFHCVLNGGAFMRCYINNCTAFGYNSAFAVTNATSVSNVNLLVFNSNFADSLTQNPAIDYGNLTSGTVQFRFASSAFYWENDGVAAYAVYGGSSTAALIYKISLGLLGSAAAVNNFTLFDITAA